MNLSPTKLDANFHRLGAFLDERACTQEKVNHNMALNDPNRNSPPRCASGSLAGSPVRIEPDLNSIRERLNDLHGRQDCELGNIHNLLNGLKEVLGIGASPRDCAGKEPAPMMGLEHLTERLMKQHAERDILLAELAQLISRRKG